MVFFQKKAFPEKSHILCSTSIWEATAPLICPYLTAMSNPAFFLQKYYVFLKIYDQFQDDVLPEYSYFFHIRTKELLNKMKAPAQFCAVLKRKLEAAGGTYHEVNTVTFRASQYNHETGTYRKKELSDRHCTIHGQWVQRDLYSAFLLMNSDASLEHTDRSRCIAAFETFLQAHNTCISEIKNSGAKVPRSFVFRAACR